MAELIGHFFFLILTVPGALGWADFSIEKEIGGSMGSLSWEPEQKSQIPGSPRYLQWGWLGLMHSANVSEPH